MQDVDRQLTLDFISNALEVTETGDICWNEYYRSLTDEQVRELSNKIFDTFSSAEIINTADELTTEEVINEMIKRFR